MLVQKQFQAQLVHHAALGERERPPHEPPEPLAQDVVEALDLAGLARALARRFIQQRLFVASWDTPPDSTLVSVLKYA